ncbi:MAG: hypothetical protein QNK37_14225 [Acidobacteriota bacterium]|nr:hypothetical protein [Acidobacteriota bacterium]
MVTLSSIQVSLKIGYSTPTDVPTSITAALESVSVTQKDNGPSAFSLQFRAERYNTFQEYPILETGLLEPYNRVVITVSLSGKQTVLMDGIITNQELSPGLQPNQASITVTGEDVSNMMDRVEVAIQWPAMFDPIIAFAIIGKYYFVGIEPEISTPPSSWASLLTGMTPQQTGTDRNYLVQMAGSHGYLTACWPQGPGTLKNTFYWGPPDRAGPDQSVINVDSGPYTNIDQITFSHDGMQAHYVYGAVMQDIVGYSVPLPVVTFMSTRSPDFATRPGLDMSHLQYKLMPHGGDNYLKAWADAQSETDQSTDKVVTVSGTLDGVRYGDVLRAPGRVVVRGAGETYNGRYYVSSVTHELKVGSYKQNFQLSREGVGSTVNSV